MNRKSEFTALSDSFLRVWDVNVSQQPVVVDVIRQIRNILHGITNTNAHSQVTNKQMHPNHVAADCCDRLPSFSVGQLERYVGTNERFTYTESSFYIMYNTYSTELRAEERNFVCASGVMHKTFLKRAMAILLQI